MESAEEGEPEPEEEDEVTEEQPHSPHMAGPQAMVTPQEQLPPSETTGTPLRSANPDPRATSANWISEGNLQRVETPHPCVLGSVLIKEVSQLLRSSEQ
eukprot:2737260-Amphidinium_carterae.2